MTFAHQVLPRSPYGHVFDIPVVRAARKLREEPGLSQQDRLVNCEFSEIGRDPHFPPGWYIIPGGILGGLLLVALLGALF
jgi:hypothetical protein